MSNAKLSRSWVVENEKSNVYDKILHFIEQHRMVIVEKNQSTISAKQGSHLITSVLGTFLAPTKYLPKTITIELQELEKGTNIIVNISKDIGLSVNNKIECKYKNFFSIWIDDLKKHLIEP